MVARLWTVLEGQLGEGAGPRPLMVLNREIGLRVPGFVFVDRDAGKSLLIQVTQIEHRVPANNAGVNPTVCAEISSLWPFLER